MNFFIIFVVFLILIVSLAYYKIRYPFVQQVNKIVGPDGLPFIGMAYEVYIVPRNSCKIFVNKLFDTYGPIFRTWIGPMPLVHVASAECTQAILSSTVNIEKSNLYRIMKPWLGVSLPIMAGDEWHKRRKVLTPAFHFSILNDFISVMVKNSKIFVERLEEIDGEEFDILPYIVDFSVDTIAETAMSVHLNTQKGSSKTYVENIEKFSKLAFRRVLNPLLHPDFINTRSKNHSEMLKLAEDLHTVSSQIIEEKVAQRKEGYFETSPNEEVEKKGENVGRMKKTTFLEILLNKYAEGEGNITLENIREEVDTFMFAGYDTVSVAIAFTIFLVGHHPEIQNRIHAELDAVIPSQDTPLNAQTLSQLKYLEWTLQDSMRLYPPAPVIARYLKEPVISGDVTIPARSEVVIHIHRIHRSAEYFANPLQFDPLNFSPERASKIHPYAYIPFSAGLRNCIGQKFAKLEAKIALAIFFKKFEVASITKMEDLKVITEIIMRPQHGIKVRIKQRS